MRTVLVCMGFLLLAGCDGDQDQPLGDLINVTPRVELRFMATSNIEATGDPRAVSLAQQLLNGDRTYMPHPALEGYYGTPLQLAPGEYDSIFEQGVDWAATSRAIGALSFDGPLARLSQDYIGWQWPGSGLPPFRQPTGHISFSIEAAQDAIDALLAVPHDVSPDNRVLGEPFEVHGTITTALENEGELTVEFSQMWSPLRLDSFQG